MSWPIILALLLASDPTARADKYFKITVVDAQTGRGVPLVELRTTNHLRYITDSNGIVAFQEPGLMNQPVFFHLQSHGYEFPKDGFGFRGKALQATEGGSAKLTIQRINIAERLYRVTGAGIYADSSLVGERIPTRRPLLNAQVMGSDSVLNAIYCGKLHWFWGDTNRPAYPLGNFQVPGATSSLPRKGGLDPEVGVDLDYFLDEKGFAKETARLPGEGPTWLTGLAVLPDAANEQRLVAAYMKVRPPLEVYARGLAQYDDAKQQFVKVATFPLDAPAYPQGHPFKHSVNGTEYIYFATPYPLIRVRADLTHWRRIEDYEAFTCLKEGSRLDRAEIDREGGKIRYAWKKHTPPVGPAEQAKLIQQKKIKPEEGLLQLRDVDTGKLVQMHAGSAYWTAYRRRWVMIAVQSWGTSMLGEVWFAEADTPVGPWVYARKVVTHDNYSFYNPTQHPMFDKDNGRVIFFEGTYSASFSSAPTTTPRYDYNQIMYKLDLADPRLALPVAVYQRSPDVPEHFVVNEPRKRLAFFALDRSLPGTVAVHEKSEGGYTIGDGNSGGGSKPLFHALPAGRDKPPATATPLYEFVHDDGKRRAYSTDVDWSAPGFRRAAKPLCLVWRNPMRITELNER